MRTYLNIIFRKMELFSFRKIKTEEKTINDKSVLSFEDLGNIRGGNYEANSDLGDLGGMVKE